MIGTRLILILLVVVMLFSSCVNPEEKEDNKEQDIMNEVNCEEIEVNDDGIKVKPINEKDYPLIKCEKPVIYLYPCKQTDIEITLEFDGELICTYPEYNDSWHVTAFPGGKLINHYDNLEYSYLFWEGIIDYEWEINSGFVVKGEDTVVFLREKLMYMGLTAKEYNEFIVYWLPFMQNNEYNLIHFAGEEYLEQAELVIEPKPDTILRVFMVFKGLNEPIEVEEQQLEQIRRDGFTVVEWGGTEIN